MDEHGDGHDSGTKKISANGRAAPNQERRHPRALFSKRVSVFQKGRFGLENSLDISEGGMLLEVEHRYEVGEIFEISLEVTGERYHSVIAQVCYLRMENGRSLIGVRFLDTHPKFGLLREEIRRFVQPDAEG